MKKMPQKTEFLLKVVKCNLLISFCILFMSFASFSYERFGLDPSNSRSAADLVRVRVPAPPITLGYERAETGREPIVLEWAKTGREPIVLERAEIGRGLVLEVIEAAVRLSTLFAFETEKDMLIILC